jgi:hypothetical protein
LMAAAKICTLPPPLSLLLEPGVSLFPGFPPSDQLPPGAWWSFPPRNLLYQIQVPLDSMNGAQPFPYFWPPTPLTLQDLSL